MLQASTKEDATKASIAATKIQANFRGYRVRKRLKESRNGESETRNGEDERYREESSEGKLEGGSSSLKKSNGGQESLEEKSAIKIQARVRGFLVRKKQQTARLAATKIQAGFRGFQIRKLLKQTEQ
ncbi:neuromodulin [Osmia bicornis bicornis]|uniref:neuromodulin n=1 Tax=Osmia bicornis bicornis TaxID=1437191 RepID=UPI0010F90B6F|nr:neuromodulin [Osmia bicornis bicornis]